MKRLLALCMAGLLLAGCSGNKDQSTYIRRVSPAQFTMLQVTDNSKFTDAIPQGRYEFSVDDDNAGNNPARFSIFVSQQEYEAMNENLEGDLVNTLGPGQDLEIHLKDGDFVYIAATSNKTGSYEEGLTGSLEIETD